MWVNDAVDAVVQMCKWLTLCMLYRTRTCNRTHQDERGAAGSHNFLATDIVLVLLLLQLLSPAIVVVCCCSSGCLLILLGLCLVKLPHMISQCYYNRFVLKSRMKCQQRPPFSITLLRDCISPTLSPRYRATKNNIE